MYIQTTCYIIYFYQLKHQQLDGLFLIVELWIWFRDEITDIESLGVY